MNEIIFLSKNTFFTTKEFAFRISRTMDSASRTLGRLSEEGILTSVTRGLWCQTQHSDFTPYAAVPYLLNTEQGYVSFLSALHRHGVISQIPSRIQVATTGHSRVIHTPIGVFDFFQMRPSLMQEGLEIAQAKLHYMIAAKEKALIDTFYLSARRGNRFSKLPELDTSELNSKVLNKLMNQLSPLMKVAVGNKLKQVYGLISLK